VTTERDDTTISLELFETSNTSERQEEPQRAETSGRDGSPSQTRRLPRRWMPTLAPRTRSGPTLAMSLVWEMKNRAMAQALAADLEEMLRASTRFALNLPGWQVYWQLSIDPKAAYRLGLILWMEPGADPPVGL